MGGGAAVIPDDTNEETEPENGGCTKVARATYIIMC